MSGKFPRAPFVAEGERTSPFLGQSEGISPNEIVPFGRTFLEGKGALNTALHFLLFSLLNTELYSKMFLLWINNNTQRICIYKKILTVRKYLKHMPFPRRFSQRYKENTPREETIEISLSVN